MNQIIKEKQDFDIQSRALKQKISDFENRKLFLIDENEKLNKIVNELKIELESWRNKYQVLDKTRQSEIEEYKHQFESLRRKIVMIFLYLPSTLSKGTRDVIEIPRQNKRA